VSALSIFVAQWNASGIAIPYVETANTPVDTNELPDKWGSAVQQADTSNDVTMGSQPQVEETGQILVGLFSRSGAGAYDLDADIQAIKTAFMGFAKNGLEIISVAGPFDMDQDQEGEWWRVGVSCEYKFYSVRNATGPGFGDWVGFP